MAERRPISFGSIGLELASSIAAVRARERQEIPFRICILGDFSGRESRGALETLDGRKPLPVDRDNIDEVLASLKVRIRLDPAGETLEVAFSCLDDFHPDNLFEQLECFQTLKTTRRKLDDPRAYNAALEDLRVLAGGRKVESKVQPLPRSRPASQQENLLDQIVGATPQPSASTDRSDMEAFLETLVRPYLVPGEDAEHDQLQSALDAYISEYMRLLLHHATFQALESAWRCVDFLVSRVETDETLEIYLLDVSKAELQQDLAASDDLTRSSMYGLFVADNTEKPWSVLTGNYTFDYSDAELLGRLSLIMHAAGAVFIAGSHAHLIGCEDLAKTPDPRSWHQAPDADEAVTWDTLRRQPQTASIGLVLPRFLMRLPYGRDTDAIDRFDFEEMDAEPRHSDYLWGNGAFACTYLLAQSFSRYGWEMQPGLIQNVEGLPLHVYNFQGEARLTPCAEVLLTEMAVEALSEKGIMALATLKNTDAACLVRLQSLADPPTGLTGRWNRSS